MLKICLLIGLSVCMAVAIPTPQEYDYEEEAVCLTSADSMDPEKECVFPFTANGTTYHGCPMDFTGDKTKRWCSTKTDENGEHVAGINAWGYCTKGCKLEISPDDLDVATEANNDTQTDTCDFSACNGYTLTTTAFENEITFGQCQFPAHGTKEDYFCFVNENSACEDKVPFGDGKFLTKAACTDPKAPLPRLFGLFGGGGFSFKSSSSSDFFGRLQKFTDNVKTIQNFFKLFLN